MKIGALSIAAAIALAGCTGRDREGMNPDAPAYTPDEEETTPTPKPWTPPATEDEDDEEPAEPTTPAEPEEPAPSE